MYITKSQQAVALESLHYKVGSTQARYLNFIEKCRLKRDFFLSVLGVVDVVDDADALGEAVGDAVGDSLASSALASSGVDREPKNASSSSSGKPGSARRLDFFFKCSVSLTLD
jgi:hypothetical protein